MHAKDVMDQIRMAHELIAIIEQLSEPVTGEMSQRLSPQLQPAEALPDLELVQQLMGRLVMARLQVLIDADEL